MYDDENRVQDGNNSPTSYHRLDLLEVYETMGDDAQSELLQWMRDNPERDGNEWPGWHDRMAAYFDRRRRILDNLDMVATDSTLSLQAKGLYVLLALFPRHQQGFHMQVAEGYSTNGRYAHRSAMKELIDAEYVRRERTQRDWKYEAVDTYSDDYYNGTEDQ